MKLNYENVIPPRYHKASYEKDVSEEFKQALVSQIQKRGGLYLYGEAGVGKTYTACAMAKYILDQGIEVRFLNTSDFLEKLRDEFNNNVKNDDEYPGLFRDTMDFKGILILDDLGAEKISDWARERIYLIVNKKYEDMTPMIFTSNCDLEILSARLGDRVSSRIMEMAELIRLGGTDRRMKKI